MKYHKRVKTRCSTTTPKEATGDLQKNMIYYKQDTWYIQDTVNPRVTLTIETRRLKMPKQDTEKIQR